mgnify:CR=1 FL=1
MSFLSFKSKDIGIDLGTANILVTIKGKGIVLREPSVIAVNKSKNEIIATGNEAKEMIGRTPKEINAIRPLKDGVIADFTATKLLLKNILERVCKREEPSGNIIVDIGGGTTEVAVISLGGIVISNSLRIAGDELDEDIINYVKKELNLAIGETTAEQVKKYLGCAMPLMTQMSMEIKGRDLSDGLPRTVTITSNQVEEAIKESIEKIVEVIKLTLEKTPPELASDIMEKGIVLAGGGSLIQNLDKLISLETGMPVYVTEEPLDCVVRGTEKTLQDLEKLKNVLADSRKRR